MVRRSAWITLFLFMTAAVAAAIAVVWLPRVQEQRDQSWAAAGQRAIAAVRLPAQFRDYERTPNGPHGVDICGGPRCFAAPGEPRDNVDAARQALAQVSTGHVSATCGADGGFASSPDKCRIVAAVAGSRVEVWLVSGLSAHMKLPVDAGDFDGTLAAFVVAPRH
jgi:hypothetical protein